MSIATQGPTTLSVEIAGREITFETGKLAKQADGAVVVREGDTMVLATAQGKTEAREGADFFPLTVDVAERMYAAGKIPGGFFKREGRPTERAILTARMIDRPIRPLWPKGFKNEVHVVATTRSDDLISPHDSLAINGASAALMISPLPFLGPVGAVRVGLIDGELVVNPTLAEVEQGDSTLDLIVVGTKDALTMVEAGAGEIPEELLLEALEQAHEEIRKLCELQEDLQRQVGKAKWVDNELTEELEREHGDKIRQRIQSDGLREGSTSVEEIVEEICPPLSMDSTEDEIIKRTQVRASLALILERIRLDAVDGPVRAQFEDDLKALTEAEQDPKELKSAKRHLLFGRIEEQVQLPFPVSPAAADGDEPAAKDSITRQYVKKAAEAVYKELVRRKIAVEKRRPDGRGSEDIREITCDVGVAPRPHGSALFTRGQTQIMTLLTLGTAKEGQRIDDLSLETDRRYMHHYNFPPYSVGETGFMRGPKRRDIGHGALAQRALEPMIPPLEEFPYTIRLVSETLESNGSSSMGSVCGSTLALMDAGVPIKAPVSGIAKGGETIRALEADYDVQIDIEETGNVLIYATEGDKADAAINAIKGLTKVPEVGDEYTGKVVKTTQFGAFVELTKGTDGLLHVSNVGPGRVGHIEDVMTRGDVVDVIVQEVDKDRGRIGLKLVAKHENGTLVQPEELIERAKNAPPRPAEEERPRGGRDRGRGGRGRDRERR